MDEQIWFYIIAAIIYLLARRKKKKPQTPQQPSSSSRPTQEKRPVTFEELLREITEGREEEQQPRRAVREEYEEEEEPIEVNPAPEEGRNRQFADEESRRVYEESVKQAEGFDIAYEQDKNFLDTKLLKKERFEVEGPTLADEIREGLQSSDSATKAIIYSEILNRKY